MHEWPARAALAAAVVCAAAVASAQTPYLVRDLNTTPDPWHSRGPSHLATTGSVLYFLGQGDANGRELRRYQPGGTIGLVQDMHPGGGGFEVETSPTEVATVGDTVFVAAHRELHRSDGSAAGTSLVRRFEDPLLTPRDLVPAMGGLFFRVLSQPTDEQLWWTDGTPANTRFLLTMASGPWGPAGLGPQLVFAHGDGADVELWSSDGTVAGTHRVKDVCPGPCAGLQASAGLAAAGGLAYFAGSDAATGSELWRTDGTEPGTQRVADVVPGAAGQDPRMLTAFGGRVLFTAGGEPWISDGTAAGTTRLAAGVEVLTLHDAGGLAFFVGRDAAGLEIWRTDGTPSGTVRVTDGCPGPCDFVAAETRFGSLPGVALFLTPDAQPRLWRSDGTVGGTIPLRAFDQAPAALATVHLAGRAYFAGFLFANGFELWSTDGTAAGTTMVEDLADASSSPQMRGAAGDRVFFSAHSADTGFEIGSSTGSAASTHLVDTNPGPAGLRLFETTVLGDRLIYSVDTAVGSSYMFSTDGTGATPLPVGRSAYLGTSGDAAYFAGSSPGVTLFDLELWRTDGTSGATFQVADLAPAPNSSTPGSFAPFAGRTYFSARDPQVAVWRTDGTAARTEKVIPRDCFLPVALGARLVLVCDDPATGGELWTSDGTAAGTQLLVDIAPGPGGAGLGRPVEMDGVLYFYASDGSTGYELWRTDATPAGSYRVIDLAPGPESSLPTALTPMGGTLYFLARTPATGYELWRTDGTAAGTALVRDVSPGPGNGVFELVRVGTRLLLTAYTPLTGIEPWQSDGTTEGTVPLPEIAPGPSSSIANGNLTAAGSTAYFAADDGVHGSEPWAVDLRPTAVATVLDTFALEGDSGDATASFAVRLESPSPTEALIGYATAPGTAGSGTDYEPRSGTLTFAPGATSATVDVPVHGDLADESDEAFTLVLTPVPPAVVSDGSATAVVVDDDGPRLAAVGSSVTEGDGVVGDAAFVLTLTTKDGTPTPGERTFAYATEPGTATSPLDFVAAAGTVTFPAGTASGATAAVHVGIYGDTLDEPDELFALALTPSGDASAEPGTTTIVDDDGIASARPVELSHGAMVRGDLAPPVGRAQDLDYYVLAQQPFASYELVVDEVSGDAAPLIVERLQANGSVLQSGTADGTGGAVRLRWRTASTFVVASEHIRVESAACASACGADDGYRLRFYETTLSAPRFNNVGGQATVVILQNASDAPVEGTLDLWGVGFSVRLELSIAPHGTYVYNTHQILPDLAGALTFAHDGPYGAVTGKAVGLDPSTGFSFDTPLAPRPR